MSPRLAPSPDPTPAGTKFGASIAGAGSPPPHPPPPHGSGTGQNAQHRYLTPKEPRVGGQDLPDSLEVPRSHVVPQSPPQPTPQPLPLPARGPPHFLTSRRQVSSSGVTKALVYSALYSLSSPLQGRRGGRRGSVAMVGGARWGGRWQRFPQSSWHDPEIFGCPRFCFSAPRSQQVTGAEQVAWESWTPLPTPRPSLLPPTPVRGSLAMAKAVG